MVVLVALVVAGAGLVMVLQFALSSSVQQATEQRAKDIAAQIEAGGVDAALVTAGAAPGDTTIVQVLDASGAVLVSSSSIADEAAIVAPIAAGSGPVSVQTPLDFVDGADYQVVAVAAGGTGGPVTVVAAQSLVPVQRTVGVVVVALLLIAPLLLVAVGAVTWAAVGRSLASVDRIRQRVDSIGGGELDERVPVPPANDEIQRLAITMNLMLARLESAMASQRQFVADASHELRSPLASMRASLDVAGRRGGDIGLDAQRVLDDEVERMTRLVGDLLLLARSEEHSLAKRRVDVDVDDILMAEARRLRAQSALVVQLDVEPARVHADPDQVAQAVRNLVDNAARFASSTIRLTSRSQGATVVLTVEDDGPGIPAEWRSDVFNRFVRLDEHRSRDEGGSGLGLAIVRQIARIHGGDAVIGASALGGAQVVLSLAAEGSPTASNR